MKRLLFAFVFVLILLFPYAIDDTAAQPDAVQKPARIDPRVRSEMATLPEGEMMTVIVTLHEQADLDQIQGAGRAGRQEGVIRALQVNSYASQKDLRNALALEGAQGNVSNYTPFWIFNGLSVTATSDVIEQLAITNGVASITPDDIDVVPAAPLAQSAPESNLSAVNAPTLWALGYDGTGVVVANLDSGVDASHPDLSGRYRGGTNSWFDPYGQHPDNPIDLMGHGTSTMGVMVGGDAGGTAIGVAPGAQWIAARIWNDSGASTATGIHLAFQWLLDPDGNPGTADAPDVVNNSWTMGAPGCDLTFETDLQSLRAAGILPVFAGGNYGPNQGSSVSPSNNSAAFAVGAVYDDQVIYELSSRGPSACDQTIYPEVVAPGVDIYTSDAYGGYVIVSGTSLSAPHAAGGLALLIDAFPDLIVGDQEAALINGAVDLGASGPDGDFGYGRLDLLAAYQWILNNPLPTPTATPEPNVNLALSQPVTVSSFSDSAHNGNAAVDGNLASSWQSKKASGKNKLPAEWITVDLGSSQTAGRVVLEWADNYATSFSIQLSEDNNTWSTVYNTTSGNGGSDTISFNAASARYVKLNSTGWSNKSLRNWLSEFEVYSGDGPPPTGTPTPEPTVEPTATPTPGSELNSHVGDLEPSSSPDSRNRWSATVSVTVHDTNETLIAGAKVGGSWSNGVSGSGTCFTDSAGKCSLSKSNIKGNVGSVTFTIDSISHASLSYLPSANHDSDGDSNGTSIQVSKP